MHGRFRATPAIAVCFAITLAACAGGESLQPSTTGTASDAAGPRRIVVDTDMGADDLLALAILLADDGVDVQAVTVAATGLAHCSGGVAVLRGLLHQLGADEVPVGCGREAPGEGGRAFPDEWRAAADAGYGLNLPSPGPAGEAAAVEVLAAAIDGSDGPVTVVELGPWSNLQDLLAAHPGLLPRIEAIHAMGGTLDAPGNVAGEDGNLVEPAVEWNVAADPVAMAAVLALDVQVGLVTLDATDQVPLSGAIYEALSRDHEAAGANVAYELLTLNGYLLQGGTFLWDELAVLALLDPDLVTWEQTPLTVTTSGPEAGHIARSDDGTAVTVTTGAAPASATDAFLAALAQGPARPDPFELSGELSATWDGASCGVDLSSDTRPGAYTLRFSNRSDEIAGLALVGVAAPHTWDDVRALARDVDPQTNEAPPEWISLLGQVQAEPGSTGSGIVRITAGLLGPVCVAGADQASLVYYTGEPKTVTP